MIPLTTSSEAFALWQRLRAAVSTQPRDLLPLARLADSDGFTVTSERHVMNRILDFRRSLLEATIVLWAPEIWLAATAGAEQAFTGSEWSDVAHRSNPQLWIVGDRQPAAAPLPELHLDVPCDQVALLLTRCSQGVNDSHPEPMAGWGVCFIFLPHDPQGLPRLRFLDLALTAKSIPASYAVAAAALQFLAEEIVTTEDTPLPRARRRDLERQGRPVPPIRTVLLRRRAPRTGEPTADDHSGRHYSCQWLVGAHWRLQPYPTLGVHKPKFIAPHIKGPTDKPLRLPSRAIYQAFR